MAKPFGGNGPPAALFHDSRDRGGTHPWGHPAGWSGILQADAYAGFNGLYAKGRAPAPLTEASCWAHGGARFFELADLAKAMRVWAHCDIRGKEAEAEHPGEVGVAQTGGCRHLRHRPATAREDGLQFMGPRNPFQQAGIHLVSRSRVRALDQEPLYPFPSVSIAPRSSIPGPAARVWTTVRGRRRRHRLADDPPDPSCEWRSPGSPGAR